MSHRHRSRLVVLSAVAAGAMLLPVSTAVAAGNASTQPASVADESPKEKAAEEKEAAAKKATDDKRAEAAKRGADAKAEAAKKAAAADQAPRGGVAAGEVPAEDTGTAPLVGSAVGVLLLVGAGTQVMRRRSARRHTV